MKKTYIISAERIINNSGNLDNCSNIESIAVNKNIEIKKLIIDPLKNGWDTPLKKNHFRSGCAPIEALQKSYYIISGGFNGIISISGRDYLRTEYKKEERNNLMKIYGDKNLLPLAYTELTEEFLKINNISHHEFLSLSEALFENYKRTYCKQFYSNKPKAKWQKFITKYFRGIDCANPVVDFSGKVLLSNRKIAQTLSIDLNNLIEVSGVEVEETTEGLNFIPVIAKFNHLEKICKRIIKTSNINWVKCFLQNQAFLETYTCYPIIPIAFLINSEIEKDFSKIPDLLNKYEITVTGGMNLGFAPWNNPSLNALIVMYNMMLYNSKKIGVIHGNGGLAYKQGIAILKK